MTDRYECQRCTARDTIKTEVRRVWTSIEGRMGGDEVKALVPNMDLCKRCRAKLRMDILHFMEALKLENRTANQ